MTTLLLIVIYISFISLGLPDSMLGAAWPSMRIELSQPIAAAGLISMLISGATILSSLLSGKLIKKLGTGKLTLISVFLTASALLGFSFSNNYLWLCIMAVPLGLGAGAVDSGLNNYVALHFAARHMSWLHCFWGIGATAGPIIMSAAIAKNGSWKNGYLSVAIIQICLVIILFVSLPLWKMLRETQQESKIIENSNQKLFEIPGVRYSFICFFCYCAIESTVGLWGASYLVNTKGVAADAAARWISIYYFGITIGRLINGFITAKVSSRALIRVGLCFIGSGAVFLLVFNQDYIELLSLILIGLGCAPLFPLMIHETPFRFGKNNSSRLMGVQMASSYAGTTLVPPALGWLSGIIGIKFYPIFILILLGFLIFSNEKINKFIAKRAAA